MAHEGSDSTDHPLYNYDKAFNIIMEGDMKCSFNYLEE